MSEFNDLFEEMLNDYLPEEKNKQKMNKILDINHFIYFTY